MNDFWGAVLERMDQSPAVQGGMDENASRPAGLDSILAERESEDAVQKGRSSSNSPGMLVVGRKLSRIREISCGL